MPSDGDLDELVKYMKRIMSNNGMIPKCGKSKEQTSFHPGCLYILPESQKKTERATHLDVQFT